MADDLFPLHEYRAHTVTDTSVKAKSVSAKMASVDTNFDAATADALASSILAATKNYAQAYTFTIDGIIALADLAGAMDKVTINFGSLTGYAAKITAVKIDWARNQTMLTVRGVA